ncbi:hypothetical protein H1P_5500002 [Hyella patelloides LEGE 07179]|uniref:Uncharacterized protein n=1 Tax=Hyella patelloides LEGE 07179 TaxID=945734 RepID=A0A563W0D2_9CYAN|nr:hypothetical protein H1P_5500002 [Hyella patelloides LEGE 07179]
MFVYLFEENVTFNSLNQPFLLRKLSFKSSVSQLLLGCLSLIR